jgi:hypothetical protein
MEKHQFFLPDTIDLHYKSGHWRPNQGRFDSEPVHRAAARRASQFVPSPSVPLALFSKFAADQPKNNRQNALYPCLGPLRRGPHHLVTTCPMYQSPTRAILWDGRRVYFSKFRLPFPAKQRCGCFIFVSLWNSLTIVSRQLGP